MPSLPYRFMLLAVLAALIGMVMGVEMGMREDFTLAPAHAHLNLLGWVSLMLFGFFYKLHPEAASGWLPQLHFAAATAGLVVMIPSLILFLLGSQSAGPILGLGSLLTLASMILFAAVVLRAARSVKALGLRGATERAV